MEYAVLTVYLEIFSHFFFLPGVLRWEYTFHK